MGLVERLNELIVLRQSGKISDSEYALLVESATQNLGKENSGVESESWKPPYDSTNASSRKLAAEFELINAPRAMKFIETIKFSYKNYVNFNGRASRSEFWYWVLFNILAAFGLIFVAVLLGLDESQTDSLLGIFILSSIIPNLARIVRRLHDTNKPWTYVLFALIPLVGNVLLTVWFCTKGDMGGNRFGPGDSSKGNQSQNEVRQKPIIAPAYAVSGQRNNRFKVAFSSFVRNKKLVITTVFMVLFLGTLQAHLQYGKLIGAIEISEAQMLEYNEIREKVWEEHSSGSPRRFTSDASRLEWESDMKYQSGIYQSRIANGGDSVRDVLLLFWNMKHEDVSSKYFLHNLAWQKNLASRKDDPYSVLYSDLISSTWLDFCREIKSGVPWYALGRFDSKISKICISDNDGNSNS